MTKVAFICLMLTFVLTTPVVHSKIVFTIVLMLSPILLKHYPHTATVLIIALLFLAPLHAKAFEFENSNPHFLDQRNLLPSGYSNHLITTNLADDDAHFLVFEQSGQMAATTTTMHVMLPLHFSEIIKQAVHINDSMYSWWKSKAHYSKQNYYIAQAMVTQTDTNLKSLSKRLATVISKIQTLEHILPAPTKPKVNPPINRHGRSTIDQLPLPPNGASDAFLSLDHPSLSRHKRFIFTLVAGIVGTFMGLYSAYQIYNLVNKVKDMSQTQDLLVHLSQEHSQALSSLSKLLDETTQNLLSYTQLNPQIVYIGFSESIMQLEDQAQKVINAVQQLQHRRLSIDWLDTQQLELLHKTIQTYTELHHFVPLTNKISDYFQLELSYVRHPQGIVALLHVPCTLSKNLMTMYKYVPFPIPIPHVTNHSHLTVAQALHPENHLFTPTPEAPLQKKEALYLLAESELIAVDTSDQYRLLSQADLTACVQRNHIYMCDKPQIMRTNFYETCLGSLFMKNHTGVRTNCRFEKRPLREEVFPLVDNEFLVYTPEPYITHAKCNNGSSFRAEFGKTTRLNIPNGCTVTLKSHSISIEENIMLPTPPYISEWKWDPLSLPADLLNIPIPINHAITNLSLSVSELASSNSLALQKLSNHTLLQAQLNHSLSSMHTLSNSLSTLQAHHQQSNADFTSKLSDHFIHSGSSLSIIFWSILCAILVIILIISGFIYRHIIMSKALKSMTWLSAHIKPTSSAPPPEYFQAQRNAYPLLTPMTTTNPPMP